MKRTAIGALILFFTAASTARASETTTPMGSAQTTTTTPPKPPKPPDSSRVDPPPKAAPRGYGDLGEDEYGPPPVARPASPTGPGLALSDRVDLSDAPAAPKLAPKAKRASRADVDRGMDGARRSDDSVLGFGNREEGIVAAAVREVLRNAPVPNGTRARVVVDIDASGAIRAVAVVTSTKGDTGMWFSQAAGIRAALGGHVELGETAKKAGVKIVVDATIVHVFSNGTDGTPIVGECSPMPNVLNDQHPAPFGAIGGAPYLEFANGTCNLQDAQGTKKHIEVKATTSAILPDIGPPPFATLDAKRPKPQRITVGDGLFGRPPNAPVTK